MAAGSKCSNCSKVLSCGCQRKIASNGSNACTSCLAKLELKLKTDKK